VRQIASAVGLDAVQLHGDEPPEALEQLRGIPAVRAFRLAGQADMPAVAQYLDRCRQLDCLPRAVLLDALRPGQFGGTGQTADWQSLAGSVTLLAGIPWVLAGGLTAENVAQAVQTLCPDAVDTASGVEKRPGEKDETLVGRFVIAARSALHAAHPGRFAAR
jgi:phosphoribosylanthranilate isomerase